MQLRPLVRTDWFTKLAAKFRAPCRSECRPAYRYRPWLETLERKELLARDVLVASMTLSVIDDGDSDYYESGSFSAALDNSQTGYSEAPAGAPFTMDDGDAGFTRSPGSGDVTRDNDGGQGYVESGSWAQSGLLGVNGGTSRYALNNSATASFTFTGLVPGQFFLSVATPPHANSTIAKYTVTSNGQTLGVFTHNQRTSSGDFTSIGSVNLTGTSLTVTVAQHDNSGTLRADAVRLGGAGWTISGLGGHQGDSLYATRATEWAKYSFTNLTAGRKEIFVNTPGHANSTTAAVYSVSSPGASGFTQTINQVAGTGGWKSLGTIDITDGNLEVLLNNGGSGVLRADGVEVRDANAWHDSSVGGHLDNSRFSYGPLAAAEYGLTSVTPGIVDLRVKLPTNTNGATNAKYEVLVGTEVIKTFTFNQRTATGDWQSLGRFHVAGIDPQAVNVRVSHGANSSGVLRADAIELTDFAWHSSPLGGHESDSRYTEHGTAGYAFTGLTTDDVYTIFVKTPGDSNSTTSAIYEIYSGGVKLNLNIPPVDQTVSTSDQLGNVEGWVPITTITLPSSDLTVRVKNAEGSSGFLRTDSIAYFVANRAPTIAPSTNPVGVLIGMHSKKDTEVGALIGDDPDGPESELKWRIVSGDEEVFRISESSGKIYLDKDAIDADARDYTVGFKVKDRDGVDSAERQVRFRIVPGVAIGGDLHAVESFDNKIVLKFIRFADAASLAEELTVDYEVEWGDLEPDGATIEDVVNWEDLDPPGSAPLSVTIPATKTSFEIELTAVPDGIPEGLTTFKVKLLPSSNGKYARVAHELTQKGLAPIVGQKEVTISIVDGITRFATGANDASAVALNDVRQGALNDCFLIAALGALAQQPGNKIQEMIKEEEGVYKVRLYADVGSEPEWVPVDPKTLLDNGARMADLTGDRDAAGNVEVWPLILERAYQQRFGEVALNSGHAYLVWRHLTGVFASITYTSDATNATLATLIQDASEAGSKIVIGRGGNFDVLINGEILRGDHAYVVGEVTAEHMELYNPQDFLSDPILFPLEKVKDFLTTIHIQ